MLRLFSCSLAVELGRINILALSALFYSHQCNFFIFYCCTDKKENEIYKEIQVGYVAKLYLGKGFKGADDKLGQFLDQGI
jgi:hypothetical protein